MPSHPSLIAVSLPKTSCSPGEVAQLPLAMALWQSHLSLLTRYLEDRTPVQDFSSSILRRNRWTFLMFLRQVPLMTLGVQNRCTRRYLQHGAQLLFQSSNAEQNCSGSGLFIPPLIPLVFFMFGSPRVHFFLTLTASRH